jgi:hypothetical protein
LIQVILVEGFVLWPKTWVLLDAFVIELGLPAIRGDSVLGIRIIHAANKVSIRLIVLII